MPTVISGANYPTSLDIAKLHGTDENELPFIAALSQDNANLTVTPFIKGNQPFGHLTAMETYSPVPSLVQGNQGYLPQFNKFAQNYDTYCTIVDGFEVEEKEAKKYGNPAMFRVQQVLGRIRAMGRYLAQLMFYGSLATNPLEFNGLLVRYNHLSTGVAATALNVINAGGTTASGQTSIWFCGMSPYGLTGIHPDRPDIGEGFAGFYHRDDGLVKIYNAPDTTGGSNGRMYVWSDYFEFQGGIGLPDWRCVQRICNLDTVDLASTNPQTDVKYYLEKALSHRPFSNNVPAEPGVVFPQPVYWFFFNRLIREALGHNLLNTMINGSGIRTENVRNPESTYMDQFTYGGHPCGVCDVITNSEAIVGN